MLSIISVFLQPTGQAAWKTTSLIYYWNTKGDFCNLLSMHLRFLGNQKIVKIWLTVPHSSVENIVNTPELPGVSPGPLLGRCLRVPFKALGELSTTQWGPCHLLNSTVLLRPRSRLQALVNHGLKLHQLKRESTLKSRTATSLISWVRPHVKRCMCRSTLYFNMFLQLSFHGFIHSNTVLQTWGEGVCSSPFGERGRWAEKGWKPLL